MFLDCASAVSYVASVAQRRPAAPAPASPSVNIFYSILTSSLSQCQKSTKSVAACYTVRYYLMSATKVGKFGNGPSLVNSHWSFNSLVHKCVLKSILLTKAWRGIWFYWQFQYGVCFLAHIDIQLIVRCVDNRMFTATLRCRLQSHPRTSWYCCDIHDLRWFRRKDQSRVR